MTVALSKGTNTSHDPKLLLCRGFEWPWTRHAIELHFPLRYPIYSFNQTTAYLPFLIV